MNIFQKIALDMVGKLIDDYTYAVRPEIFIDEVLYYMQSADDDSEILIPGHPCRYWLLSQRMVFTAILKLGDTGLLPDQFCMDFLKELLYLPDPDHYEELMSSDSNPPIGIGLKGMGTLQLSLYKYAGWTVSRNELVFRDDDLNFMDFDSVVIPFLFSHIPRKYIGKVYRMIYKVYSEYEMDSYQFFLFHYSKKPSEDLISAFDDILTNCEMEHLEDDNLIAVLAPTNCIDAGYGLECGVDMSSLHPSCVFKAIYEMHQEPPLLPCFG